MWLLQFSKKEVKSKPKSLGLKKQPSICETKMGGQGLLLLIHLKIMVIITSLQNTVIAGTQGLLMSMGSKVLIKMTRLLYIVLFISMFCGLVIVIKNFDNIKSS